MRILMTTNAAIGHFLPLAPTAAELVARGHEVRVGCPESFARFVAKAGFVAMPCREVDVSVPTPPPPPVEDHEARLRWAVTLSWPDDCRTWVDSLLRKVTRWAPDLVIVEPVEHAGRVVAAALDTPLVVHGWGFTLPADVEETAAAEIADVYQRASAPPARPALITDLGPSSIQAPDIGAAQRYSYRPFSGSRYPLPPPPTEHRRVLVTLGTYPNPTAASLIRLAADAALDTGADVVAVLGNEDRHSSEPFRAGVTVLKWVDMSAAIRSCDLVVHHGGAGTSWTALSHGKPAVVVPLGGDHFRNADILSAAGAAIVCTSRYGSDLSSAISTGLCEPRYTERATAISRDNAALPTVAEMAHRISRLTTES